MVRVVENLRLAALICSLAKIDAAKKESPASSEFILNRDVTSAIRVIAASAVNLRLAFNQGQGNGHKDCSEAADRRRLSRHF